MEVLSFLIWPFAACVLLILIHAYFGIHILERGIIFVDLSLAQFVGVGIALSFLFGHEGPQRYIFSIFFALLGALYPGLFPENSKIHQYRGLYRGALHFFICRKHPDSGSLASRTRGVQVHTQREHNLGRSSECFLIPSFCTQ